MAAPEPSATGGAAPPAADPDDVDAGWGGRSLFPPPPTRPPPVLSLPPTGDALTLLLVGRGFALADELLEALEEQSLYVETATDDVQAAVVTVAPDIVVLLGDAAAEGGEAVARRLAASPLTSAVPVVLVLGEDRLELRLRALLHGIAAVIPGGAAVDALAREIARTARELAELDTSELGTARALTADQLFALLTNEQADASTPAGTSKRLQLTLGARQTLPELRELVEKQRPEGTNAASAEPPKPEPPKPEVPEPAPPAPEVPTPAEPRPAQPEPEVPAPDEPQPEPPAPEVPDPAPQPEVPEPAPPQPEIPERAPPQAGAAKPSAAKPEQPERAGFERTAPQAHAPKAEAPKREAPRPEALKPRAPMLVTRPLTARAETPSHGTHKVDPTKPTTSHAPLFKRPPLPSQPLVSRAAAVPANKPQLPKMPLPGVPALRPPAFRKELPSSQSLPLPAQAAPAHAPPPAAENPRALPEARDLEAAPALPAAPAEPAPIPAPAPSAPIEAKTEPEAASASTGSFATPLPTPAPLSDLPARRSAPARGQRLRENAARWWREQPPRKRWLAGGLTLLCVAAVGLAVGFTNRSRASVTVSAPQPVVSPPGPRPLSVIERARSGDVQALAALEALPSERRSAEESHAIVRGRIALKHRQLETLLESMRADAALLDDKSKLAELRAYLESPATAVEALRGIAELPGSRGPDFLYDVVSKRKKPDETSLFAEELLYGETARHKASPALRVALELRRLSGCDQAERVVSDAQQHADRRALIPLVRLTKRRGCGPKGRQDCYPCLQNRAGVMAAVRAAKKRPAPKL